LDSTIRGKVLIIGFLVEVDGRVYLPCMARR
jgi:hypothetical protein